LRSKQDIGQAVLPIVLVTVNTPVTWRSKYDQSHHF
jgi:hypothetical protein